MPSFCVNTCVEAVRKIFIARADLIPMHPGDQKRRNKRSEHPQNCLLDYASCEEGKRNVDPLRLVQKCKCNPRPRIPRAWLKFLKWSISEKKKKNTAKENSGEQKEPAESSGKIKKSRSQKRFIIGNEAWTSEMDVSQGHRRQALETRDTRTIWFGLSSRINTIAISSWNCSRREEQREDEREREKSWFRSRPLVAEEKV